MLQGVAGCCRVTKCCRVLQCGLQFVALRSSDLHCVAVKCRVCCSVFVSLLLFAAVYFSLLQRVASCACVCVCCSVCLRVL